MHMKPMGIAGAWEFVPVVHKDSRGLFLEAFADEHFVKAVGHPLELRQMNASVSAAGVVRGIHFADVPPG